MASAFKYLFFFCALMMVAASGVQFQVGDKIGWRKPTGRENETYNDWAGRNRFRVGDALYFKYKRDSVVEVSGGDYLTCNASNPISRFDDGNTVFLLDRPGFFYFISGKPGHCEGGEKLIVRVMHPSEAEAPVPAPSPGGGGASDDVHHDANSTTRLSIISIFMAALGGLVVLLYLIIAA